MVAEVDLVLSDLDSQGGLAAGEPPGDRADAGQQLLEVEGLDDVVVGSRVERVHLVGAADAPGKHDNRYRRPGAQVDPQGSQDLRLVIDDKDAAHSCSRSCSCCRQRSRWYRMAGSAF